jgi:hypothetical protein
LSALWSLSSSSPFSILFDIHPSRIISAPSKI